MVLVDEATGELFALFALLLALIVAAVAVVATVLGLRAHHDAKEAYAKAMGRAERALLLGSLVDQATKDPPAGLRPVIQEALSEADSAVRDLEETPISVLTAHAGRGAYTGQLLMRLTTQQIRARQILSQDEPQPPDDGTVRF